MKKRITEDKEHSFIKLPVASSSQSSKSSARPADRGVEAPGTSISMSDISGQVVMIRCADSKVLDYEGMEIDCEGTGLGKR